MALAVQTLQPHVQELQEKLRGSCHAVAVGSNKEERRSQDKSACRSKSPAAEFPGPEN